MRFFEIFYQIPIRVVTEKKFVYLTNRKRTRRFAIENVPGTGDDKFYAHNFPVDDPRFTTSIYRARTYSSERLKVYRPLLFRGGESRRDAERIYAQGFNREIFIWFFPRSFMHRVDVTRCNN